MNRMNQHLLAHAWPPLPTLQPRLPGLDYTHEQLFFINFGRVWCSQARPAMELRQVLTGKPWPRETIILLAVGAKE